MTRLPNRPSVGDYQIGYGKPPRHTRFGPGKSGNPGGRPRGASAGRADRLALKEIYRLIAVREGDQTLTLPTFQAMIRQLGRIALKGNGSAIRTYFGLVQAIEQRVAMHAADKTPDQPMPNVTDEDRAKALMMFLNRVKLRDPASGTTPPPLKSDDKCAPLR
jgi:Family of unknown function (DUF5681)